MYGQIFNTIKSSVPEVSDTVIARIIYECFYRMDILKMDKTMLLEDYITVTLNENDIDIKAGILFGIFWSFDKYSGELVGT